MSSSAWSPVKPGDVLAGKYRVERVLGAGGMGVVVCAMHVDLGELRAVKFMLPHAVTSGTAVERFFREARAAARLRSGHVAQVHDMGRLETGEPYIVMEYLEGSDLAAVLKKQGPLPIEVAVRYVIQACEGLAEAHAAGVVHRDLKPANLFLGKAADGAPQIKVLDFGISKLTQEGTPSELTDTEATIGSPYHMSPEQVRSSRDVDHRTDIWSLGVILYQLVTGTLPFQGDGRLELCLAIVQDDPPRPSSVREEVPPDLEAAILRCLAKSPEARFPDVGKLAASLAALLPDAETTLRVKRIARLAAGGKDTAGEPAVAPEPPPVEPVPASTQGGATDSSWGGPRGAAPPPRSFRRWAVAGGVALAIAGALLGRRALYPDPPPDALARPASGPAAPAVTAAAEASPAPSPSPNVAPAVVAPTEPPSPAPTVSASAGAPPPAALAPPKRGPGTAGAATAIARATAAPVEPPPPAAAPPAAAPPAAAPPATSPPADPFGRARK